MTVTRPRKWTDFEEAVFAAQGPTTTTNTMFIEVLCHASENARDASYQVAASPPMSCGQSDRLSRLESSHELAHEIASRTDGIIRLTHTSHEC